MFKIQLLSVLLVVSAPAIKRSCEGRVSDQVESQTSNSPDN